MNNCKRELTLKELVENSNIENKEKDLILARLKEESEHIYNVTNQYEKIVSEQRYLIEAYRIVLADMIYGNQPK